MNDDYLWDKTGKPDPEIQQLEEILGELRYQPRPLEIPANVKIGRERNFFRDSGPRLAIAATIAMLVIGLGAWFAVQRLQRDESKNVAEAPAPLPLKPTQETLPAASDKGDSTVAVSSPQPEQKRTTEPAFRRVRQPLQSANANRSRSVATANRQLTVSDREGEAAKNQLMLALRLASEKLNFAQKKTQNTNSRDQIHNQHKIG